MYAYGVWCAASEYPTILNYFSIPFFAQVGPNKLKGGYCFWNRLYDMHPAKILRQCDHKMCRSTSSCYSQWTHCDSCTTQLCEAVMLNSFLLSTKISVLNIHFKTQYTNLNTFNTIPNKMIYFLHVFTRNIFMSFKILMFNVLLCTLTHHKGKQCFQMPITQSFSIKTQRANSFCCVAIDANIGAFRGWMRLTRGGTCKTVLAGNTFRVRVVFNATVWSAYIFHYFCVSCLAWVLLYVQFVLVGQHNVDIMFVEKIVYLQVLL